MGKAGGGGQGLRRLLVQVGHEGVQRSGEQWHILDKLKVEPSAEGHVKVPSLGPRGPQSLVSTLNKCGKAAPAEAYVCAEGRGLCLSLHLSVSPLSIRSQQAFTGVC